MKEETVKHNALQIVNKLSDVATWDDLMYRIYVRQSIESGLEDSNAGRTVDVDELRTKFGLSK
jgi:predicted transcriptional regulator